MFNIRALSSKLQHHAAGLTVGALQCFKMFCSFQQVTIHSIPISEKVRKEMWDCIGTYSLSENITPESFNWYSKWSQQTLNYLQQWHMGNKLFCTRYSAKCYQSPITSEVRLQWYPASLWYSQKHPRCHFLQQLFHLRSSHCSISPPLSSTSWSLIHAVNPLTSPKTFLKSITKSNQQRAL